MSEQKVVDNGVSWTSWLAGGAGRVAQSGFDATKSAANDAANKISSVASTAYNTSEKYLPESRIGRAAVIGTAAAATGTVAVLATPLVLSAVGFSSAGVVTGSTAAAIQSTMGGVIVKGGAFAIC